MIVGTLGSIVGSLTMNFIKKNKILWMPISFIFILVGSILIFNFSDEKLFNILFYLIAQAIFGIIYSWSLLSYYNGVHTNIYSDKIGKFTSITMIYRILTSLLGNVALTILFIYLGWNISIICYVAMALIMFVPLTIMNRRNYEKNNII